MNTIGKENIEMIMNIEQPLTLKASNSQEYIINNNCQKPLIKLAWEQNNEINFATNNMGESDFLNLFGSQNTQTSCVTTTQVSEDRELLQSPSGPLAEKHNMNSTLESQENINNNLNPNA